MSPRLFNAIINGVLRDIKMRILEKGLNLVEQVMYIHVAYV